MKKFITAIRSQSTFAIAWDIKVFRVLAIILALGVVLNLAVILLSGFNAPVNSLLVPFSTFCLVFISYVHSELWKEFASRDDVHEYI